MFTCKNCRKKVPTINAKNQLCVDCDRARKRGKVEEPSPMIGKVEEPKKAEESKKAEEPKKVAPPPPAAEGKK